MLTLLVARNLVGSRAGPMVAIPRTGSVVNPLNDPLEAGV
jgi:hypothetical protein